MNLRQRWMAASALLFLSAAAAQRARATESDVKAVPPPISVILQSGEGSALRLTSPISSGTVARVLADAEAAYQRGDLAQAAADFSAVTEIDAANPMAWLRLGNIHQKAGQEDRAMQAYRQAVGPVDGQSLRVQSVAAEAQQREAIAKALLNIALISVGQASRAIDSLDQLDLAQMRAVRHDVARQVGAQRHRAYRSARQVLDVNVPVQGPSVPAPNRSAAAVGDHPQAIEPYTVDRWTSLPRRVTGKQDGGRSAITEPLREDPPPPRPVVEHLQGGLYKPASLTGRRGNNQ